MEGRGVFWAWINAEKLLLHSDYFLLFKTLIMAMCFLISYYIFKISPKTYKSLEYPKLSSSFFFLNFLYFSLLNKPFSFEFRSKETAAEQQQVWSFFIRISLYIKFILIQLPTVNLYFYQLCGGGIFYPE